MSGYLLPILLARISKKYNLSHIIPFKNLSYNYVASALQDKNNVVIKLGIDFQDLKKKRMR